MPIPYPGDGLETPPASLATRSVLAAGDNAVFRASASGLLRSMGYRVDLATAGVRAGPVRADDLERLPRGPDRTEVP